MEPRCRPDRLAAAVAAAALFFVIPTRAGQASCADLARPATFDEHTAMAAIFCEYDRGKSGTLLPVEHTKPWDMTRVEYLVTPMLAATYVEGGVEKGVLVAQRQIIVEIWWR
jgi:hypothetical protein